MKKLTVDDVKKMNYVQLLANIDEINRPPGGKDSIRRIVQNTFLTKDSSVLDVGCNTGYCAFEITHLVKCHIVGVDISPEMVRAANRFREKDIMHRANVEFRVADGMKLPFVDESFDLTMSGGSTAFIDNKVMAIKEYSRVTKTWGFVADVNFFYKEEAPNELIEKLNRLMDINIKPWGKNYWLDVYKQADLESYYTYTNDVYVPSVDEIETYGDEMSAQLNADNSAKSLVKKRLIKIMSFFAENHRYLAYGVFVLRKRDMPEQISLFGA